MKLTDHKLLEYLHDAECLEVAWDCNNPDERRLHITTIVQGEAGYSLWEGKKLKITLSNVVIANLKSLGCQAGVETIDTWRPCISETLEQECAKMKALGIEVPLLKCLISFHSGSFIEVVCSCVSVSEVA